MENNPIPQTPSGTKPKSQFYAFVPQAKKSFRYASLLTTLVLAVLFLCVDIFCFWRISLESEKFLSVKNEIFSLSGQAEDVESFKKSYEQYRSNLKKIEAMFVDPKDPLNLIQFLEDSAAQTKTVLRMSALSQVSATDKKNYLIQLNLTGDSGGIMQFLKAVENAPYFVSVQTVSIGSPKTVSKSGNKGEPVRQDIEIMDAQVSIKVLTN